MVPKIKALRNDPLEKEIEQRFREKVRKLGGRAYKFTSPGNRSVPDRLVVLPGGVVFFVEFKRRGAKPTPNQWTEINFLRALGFDVYVIDSDEGWRALLCDIGKISAATSSEPYIG